jgi:hypothetical protein
MLNIKPGRLELIDGAKPYYTIPFSVPQSLEGTTKTEMKRLTDIDVFNRSSDSEWAAPTFIQAKKIGDVRILTDFRRINAQIKRRPFPLPKISDLLRKLSGFKYATAIDLSMGYYHIPLDLEVQKLCTTILPWGKYEYNVNTSGKAGAQIPHLPLGDDSSPRGRMQYAGNLTLFTWMCVTSHSQPLINAKHQIASNKILVNNN